MEDRPGPAALALRTAVIVPTYNEAANIGALVEAILAAVPDSVVYIVDDSSPDGTAEAVRALAGPRVRLVVRAKKDGRGGAVIEGLRVALGASEAFERLVEMDADFSHDPRDLPSVIAAAQAPGTVGVGSRYEPGSRIEGWPLRRRVFSRLVNVLLRLVVDPRYSDLSNGFRCYGREAAARLAAHRFSSRGYIVLSEQALVLRRAGVRPVSVPTRFVNRTRGASNLGLRELADAARGLLVLIRLRFGGGASEGVRP